MKSNWLVLGFFLLLPVKEAHARYTIRDLLTLPAFAAEKPENIPVLRAYIVRSCSDLKTCMDIVSEAESVVNVEVSKFSKGGFRGFHGAVKATYTVDEIPFKSEIIMNKRKDGYSFLVTLRSGPGTKRVAATKKIAVKTSSEFESFTVVDKPISAQGKIYRAELRISSVSKP